MESSTTQQPQNLVTIEINQQNKNIALDINENNLKSILQIENIQIDQQDQFQQCFVIGVIGKQQIGKSTLLRSLFQVPFKSSSQEHAGQKTTYGIDMALKSLYQINTYHSQNEIRQENIDENNELQIVMFDAEGFRGPENIINIQDQITWESNKKAQIFEARKLSNLSSLLQSLFLLETCNILFVITQYDDDWQEFEDFIESFEKFNTLERDMPRIIFLIRGADNKYKQELARVNFQKRVIDLFGLSDQIDEQNQYESQQIQLKFLPEHTNDGKYLKDNASIVKEIRSIINEEIKYLLPSKILLMQQILQSINNLNNSQNSLNYEPISTLEKDLLMFQALYPNEDSLIGVRSLYKEIQDVLNKESEFTHNLNILNIQSKKDLLFSSRALYHTMSGISMGTTAAGVGTASAALAGVAIIPVIGWTIAGLTLGGLAAKIAVEKTIIENQNKEVQQTFEKICGILNQAQSIESLIMKLIEYPPIQQFYIRLLLQILDKHNGKIKYNKILQNVKDFCISQNNQRQLQMMKRQDHSLQHSQSFSTNFTSVTSDEELKQDIGQYMSKAAGVGERVGNSLLQTTMKVENLTRNASKIYKVTDVSYVPVSQLQNANNLGGFASRTVGKDAYRLIGQNTKSVTNVNKFNPSQVTAMSTGAKVAQGAGLALGVIGLTLEAFQVFQNEDDFNKKKDQFDIFEKQVKEVKELMPNWYQFLKEFKQIKSQYQPQENN